MVGEAVILLRVEHFQQRGRGVTPPVRADLVDLVQDDDRVAGLGVAQGADDPAGDGADVGAPVPADFRLIAHAAQTDAHHFATNRLGHRRRNRSLADAGRPVQVDDRALHVLAGQFTNGDILHDSFFHVLEAVMVLIEHLPNMGNVEVVFRLIGPGKLDQPLKIGANDAGFGRLLALILQALQLAEGAFQNLLRHAGVFDLGSKIVRPIRFLIAQFLADGLHLLAEHEIALRFLRTFASIALNLAADIGNAHFLAQVFQNRLQSGSAAEVGQQADFHVERQVDQAADVVRQFTGRLAGPGHGHHLLVRLAHQLDILFQVGNGLQLELFVDGVFLGQFHVTADEKGFL